MEMLPSSLGAGERRQPCSPLWCWACMQPPTAQKGLHRNFKLKGTNISSMLVFSTYYQRITFQCLKEMSFFSLSFIPLLSKVENTGLKNIVFFFLMGICSSFPLYFLLYKKGCIYFWTCKLAASVFVYLTLGNPNSFSQATHCPSFLSCSP